MARPPGPTLPGERIVALDLLRGFAMFGVLVAYCLWSLGTAPEATFTPLDRGVDAVAGFLVDHKAYTLLAFLFGLGFHLQLSRSPASDAEAAHLYRRRLFVLMAIGLVHAVLLRNGDILLPYAIAGLLLVPFRRARDGVVLAAALLLLLWPAAVQALWQASGAALPQRPQTTGMALLPSNLAWLRYWYATAPIYWPLNLSLMLLGLLAGRRHLILKIAGDRTLAWRIVAAGLAGALLFRLASGLPDEAALSPLARQEATRLLYIFHAWSLAAAYAALLLLALRTPAGARLLQPLAAVGRMALTNYLLQAILIVPLSVAFDLFDHYTPSGALALALGLFALQLPFSVYWLKRFDFGPAEWLWRRLTYGRGPAAPRAAEAPL